MSRTQTITYTINLSKKKEKREGEQDEEEMKEESEEKKKIPKKRVTWVEDTIDNENLNRKKSNSNLISMLHLHPTQRSGGS